MYVDGRPTTATDPLGLCLWGACDTADSLLTRYVDPALRRVATPIAGFGDAASFGLTDEIRDWMGTNDVVDKCSGWYTAGKIAGYGAVATLSGLGIAARSAEAGIAATEEGIGLSARTADSVAVRNISRLAGRPLPKPVVSDLKLRNYVDDLYKGTTNPSRVGNGTTADAVRAERSTGNPVGGKFHTQKAQDTARGLRNWLNRNPGADPRDRAVAESLYDDLVDALGRVP
jgi:hypothetical protein